MKDKIYRRFIPAGVLLLLFIVLAAVLLTVDVRPIGPNGSSVGFATLNQLMFAQLGVHPTWYMITDWMGKAAICVAAAFAVSGMVQLAKRRSIRHVDSSIVLLGAIYAAAVAAYIFFELFVVNYRPIILSEELEASFPSSHTMLVICIMGTALLYFHSHIKRKSLRITLEAVAAFMIAVTIFGRLISGVHWFTDIIAGVLLGSFFVALYAAAIGCLQKKSDTKPSESATGTAVRQ